MDTTSTPAVSPRSSRLITHLGERFLVDAFQDPFGSSARLLSAWVPASIFGVHAVISTQGTSELWGRVGTERFESDLPALSEERLAAARIHRTAMHDKARAAILAAFPEASGRMTDCGWTAGRFWIAATDWAQVIAASEVGL